MGTLGAAILGGLGGNQHAKGKERRKSMTKEYHEGRYAKVGGPRARSWGGEGRRRGGRERSLSSGSSGSWDGRREGGRAEGGYYR